MRFNKYLLIVLFTGLASGLHAQDILLSLTGKEIPCIITSVDTFFVEYHPLGKLQYIEKSLVKSYTHRKFFMHDGSEKDIVFDTRSFDPSSPYLFYREPLKGLKHKDRYNFFLIEHFSFDTITPVVDSIPMLRTEKILYAQDSMHRKFELPVEDMRMFVYGRRSARRYFHSPLSTLGGIATGFGGGLILNFFYSALPAATYTAINGSIKPKMKTTGPEDQPYLQDELFEDGYRHQARIIKAQNSVFGAVPALGVGILLRYFGTVR